VFATLPGASRCSEAQGRDVVDGRTGKVCESNPQIVLPRAMVLVRAANAVWYSLAFSWLATFAEGGGGEAAVISCEQGDAGLVCSRNTTAVDNATEIVEIRLQVDRASLETTEISVPGYRLIIEIPEGQGGSGFMNSLTGGDSMGVGSIILGNLAAMGSLLLFCGIIATIAGQKNKKKIEEVQSMVNQGMEMAGIVPPGGESDDDSSDEEALYMSETGDGISLDKKSLAASAAHTWRENGKKGKKGGGTKKNAMFSAFAGVASQLMVDPHAQEMLRHAKDDLEDLGHIKMMNPMQQDKKVFNPMRDSTGTAPASPLGEGLLGGESVSQAAHGMVDSVAKRTTKNPMAEVIAEAAHKKLDSAGIDAPAGKKKGKK
jgi:hypothetical protein